MALSRDESKNTPRNILNSFSNPKIATRAPTLKKPQKTVYHTTRNLKRDADEQRLKHKHNLLYPLELTRDDKGRSFIRIFFSLSSSFTFTFELFFFQLNSIDNFFLTKLFLDVLHLTLVRRYHALHLNQ